LLAYEGIIYLAKTNFSKILFYCITGFGMICAWLAKSTVVY